MSCVEEWRQGRQRWRRVTATADEAFILSADLGQSNDPTAFCVLRYSRTPLDEWVTTHGTVNVNTQQTATFFDVVYLERIRLGTTYPAIVDHARRLLERDPLRGGDFVIDETGVGRPVGDMFDAAGTSPVRVSITAGHEVVNAGARRYHVPKGQLVSTLDAKLHCGELRFAKDLANSHELAEELKDFQRHVTAAGRATYQARTGRHDDLVLAVAIGAWWALERRKRGTVYCGTLKGLC
jgi:hypothetical protein